MKKYNVSASEKFGLFLFIGGSVTTVLFGLSFSLNIAHWLGFYPAPKNAFPLWVSIPGIVIGMFFVLLATRFSPSEKIISDEE